MAAQPLGSGRKRGRGVRFRRRARMSEINVTPFVDVMLVLLIVFMVAAPLLTVGVPVNLPQTAAKPLPAEQREPVTVNVDAAGRIFLQGAEAEFAVFRERLGAIASERGVEDRVFVRADQAVDYGLVMQVMGELSALGFSNLGLVTDAGKSVLTPTPTPAPAASDG